MPTAPDSPPGYAWSTCAAMPCDTCLVEGCGVRNHGVDGSLCAVCLGSPRERARNHAGVARGPTGGGRREVAPVGAPRALSTLVWNRAATCRMLKPS